MSPYNMTEFEAQEGGCHKKNNKLILAVSPVAPNIMS